MPPHKLIFFSPRSPMSSEGKTHDEEEDELDLIRHKTKCLEGKKVFIVLGVIYKLNLPELFVVF